MLPTICRIVSILALLMMSAAAPSCASELIWSDARQLVLVTTASWNANQGTLQAFVMTHKGWQQAMPAFPITIGREGAAWGIGLHPTQSGPAKKEGDGRSPAGVFRIGSAFGYSESVHTALRYKAMTDSDYCIDVSASPLYNRIVDAHVVGKQAIEGSTEPMRRDIHADGDRRYKLGFIIEHNSKGKTALGSCIFAHVWRQPGEATSGCTAMDEANMQSLLAWLQEHQNPIFVLLPREEYERVRADWKLPSVSSD